MLAFTCEIEIYFLGPEQPQFKKTSRARRQVQPQQGRSKFAPGKIAGPGAPLPSIPGIYNNNNNNDLYLMPITREKIFCG